MIKAVFFDVDDTLYDHLIPFRKAIQAWTIHDEAFPYEQAYHRMRYYSDMLSLELGGAGKMEEGASTEYMQRKRFQLALEEFNITVSEEEASEIQQRYLDCQFDIECFQGALALIQDLQRANYVVGILTNGAYNHQWKKINGLGLERYIRKEHIFVSGAHGIDKPNPTIFKLINEQINLSPKQCLYIGDSWRNDVVGATKAKWNVIWFNHRQLAHEEEIALYGEASNYTELRAYLF